MATLFQSSSGCLPNQVIRDSSVADRYSLTVVISFLYISRSSGSEISSISSASEMTSLTLFKACPPVICRVPAKIVRPSLEMIRRYPHQLWASPALHLRKAAFRERSLRSHVLKEQGTKYSSASFLTTGSAKMTLPASLHPCHPLHSAKFAKMGLPVSEATFKAILRSP